MLWLLVLCWEVLWFWIVFVISAWDLGDALDVGSLEVLFVGLVENWIDSVGGYRM